ncbi:hypothetical protein BJG94_15805 [Rhizobium sp. Td3]|nr:hypothetical protein BJG94_15805 [Rhizobium sp. Td3]
MRAPVSRLQQSAAQAGIVTYLAAISRIDAEQNLPVNCRNVMRHGNSNNADRQSVSGRFTARQM